MVISQLVEYELHFNIKLKVCSLQWYQKLTKNVTCFLFCESASHLLALLMYWCTVYVQVDANSWQAVIRAKRVVFHLNNGQLHPQPLHIPLALWASSTDEGRSKTSNTTHIMVVSAIHGAPIGSSPVLADTNTHTHMCTIIPYVLFGFQACLSSCSIFKLWI